MTRALTLPLSWTFVVQVCSADLPSTLRTAQAGDTVRVAAGTYDGNLVLDKRLVLLGTDQPVLRGGGEGSVVTLTADSCVIRGFVIEHSGRMLVNEDSGVLVKSNGNLIEENELRDVLFGVYLFQANGTVVRNNRIRGRASLPVGERGSGIHIWNSNDNRFTGNSIADVRDGFYVLYARHSLIERNDACNLRYGVHYMYADSNVFLSNRFSNNVAGAAIMYSRGITFRHNVFSHNRGFSSFGILFQDCHGLTADSNVISDNVVGLFFEASTGNSFRRNIISQNDVALQMFQNATGNLFSENNFIDNLQSLVVVGKRTETSWSEAGRGNYWSDYTGYDLDADGVGDVSMKVQNVFGYLEGRNGAVRLYLHSPAAQALAVAATTFPILDVCTEVDDHPLQRPLDLGSLPAVGLMTGKQDHPGGGAARQGQAWMAVPALGIAFAAGLRALARRGLR